MLQQLVPTWNWPTTPLVFASNIRPNLRSDGKSLAVAVKANESVAAWSVYLNTGRMATVLPVFGDRENPSHIWYKYIQTPKV